MLRFDSNYWLRRVSPKRYDTLLYDAGSNGASTCECVIIHTAGDTPLCTGRRYPRRFATATAAQAWAKKRKLSSRDGYLVVPYTAELTEVADACMLAETASKPEGKLKRKLKRKLERKLERSTPTSVPAAQCEEPPTAPGSNMEAPVTYEMHAALMNARGLKIRKLRAQRNNWKNVACAAGILLILSWLLMFAVTLA